MRKRRFDVAEEHSRRLNRMYLRELNKARFQLQPEFQRISELVSELHSENALTISENSNSVSEIISETVPKNSEIVLEIPETISELVSEKILKFPNVFQKSVNALDRTTAGDSGSFSENNAVNAQVRMKANQAAYYACDAYMKQLGLLPPKLTKKTGFSGCLKRMQDAIWWRKQLRRIQNRKTEEVMRLLGKVSKRAGKYCSD